MLVSTIINHFKGGVSHRSCSGVLGSFAMMYPATVKPAVEAVLKLAAVH